MSRCQSSFEAAFTRVEGQFGAACPTVADATVTGENVAGQPAYAAEQTRLAGRLGEICG